MAIGDKGLSVTKAGAGKKGLSLKFSFHQLFQIILDPVQLNCMACLQVSH